MLTLACSTSHLNVFLHKQCGDKIKPYREFINHFLQRADPVFVFRQFSVSVVSLCYSNNGF